MAGKRPVIGSYDYCIIKAKAHEVMKDNLRVCPHASAMRSPSIDDNIMPSCLSRMYMFGNAWTGSTYHNNRKALEQWHVVPRMLRDATHRNHDVGVVFFAREQQS